MRVIFFFIFLILILHPSSQAQSKNKAEKEFIKQINTILKNSSRQQSGYNGTMIIDSAFAINKEGILSVTVRYRSDSSFVSIRTTVPVNKIVSTRYDLYMILECIDPTVTMYESENGSDTWKEVNKGGWFYIGAPLPENVVYQNRLKKALERLMKYVKK